MTEKFGRRKCLAIGALCQFVCFLIFASLGKFKLENADGSNSQTIGYVMIVFTCLFIVCFSTTSSSSPQLIVQCRPRTLQRGVHRHGLSLLKSIHLDTDRSAFRFAVLLIGCSISSSLSSLHSSLETLGLPMDMFSQVAIWPHSSLFTSSSLVSSIHISRLLG